MNGGGGFCRELLTDDRAYEGGKRINRGRIDQSSIVETSDDGSQDRIAADQDAPRASVLVRRHETERSVYAISDTHRRSAVQ